MAILVVYYIVDRRRVLFRVLVDGWKRGNRKEIYCRSKIYSLGSC